MDTMFSCEWKQVISGLKILAWKWSKIAAQKEVFLDEFGLFHSLILCETVYTTKLMRLIMLLKRCVSLHRFYYPHRSRDSVSPVCEIFLSNLQFCTCRCLDPSLPRPTRRRTKLPPLPLRRSRRLLKRRYIHPPCP